MKQHRRTNSINVNIVVPQTQPKLDLRTSSDSDISSEQEYSLREKFYTEYDNSARNILLGSPARWAISVGLLVLLVFLTLQATSKIGEKVFLPKRSTETIQTTRNVSTKGPSSANIDSLLVPGIHSRCSNTQQGRDFITDSDGFVCLRKDLNGATGCCRRKEDEKPPTEIFPRFSCRTCNATTQCCSSYELCTSCCMDPSNAQLKLSVVKGNPAYDHLRQETDPFNYCRSVCRTSSRSVFAINRYRNADKHCFGPEAPPISQEMKELVAQEQSLPPPTKKKRSLAVEEQPPPFQVLELQMKNMEENPSDDVETTMPTRETNSASRMRTLSYTISIVLISMLLL
ncbi:hypothetical protein PROFUN_08664 [Planoprotostelium fungivorum]|uniref:SREBP regulating gene protein n=1 Tax=Planoprotostelium fungivorum TaxID=1890364 RepID=A0A2P6NJ46_9EUKA|nr:hypothetical protein PROFUN_08664 [Planoprotostelium fungivorum]